MFRGMIAIALLAIAGIASAADFTYAPATDGSFRCYTYCVGYETSDPAHTVDYVDVVYYSASAGYRITVSADGQTYQGYTLGNGLQFTAQGIAIGGTTGISYTGTYALMTVSWSSRRTCVRSGRGQHCTTYYSANLPGAISIP